jgi:hypothetical protein
MPDGLDFLKKTSKYDKISGDINYIITGWPPVQPRYAKPELARR